MTEPLLPDLGIKDGRECFLDEAPPIPVRRDLVQKYIAGVLDDPLQELVGHLIVDYREWNDAYRKESVHHCAQSTFSTFQPLPVSTQVPRLIVHALLGSLVGAVIWIALGCYFGSPLHWMAWIVALLAVLASLASPSWPAHRRSRGMLVAIVAATSMALAQFFLTQFVSMESPDLPPPNVGVAEVDATDINDFFETKGKIIRWYLVGIVGAYLLGRGSEKNPDTEE